MTTGLLEQRVHFSRKEYSYGFGGNGSSMNAAGKKLIDCSHLLNQMLIQAGYNIPYQSTSELGKSEYYESVAPESVQPGDLALWVNSTANDGHRIAGHVGVVEAGIEKSANGSFFGSQTSTGPASAFFGLKPAYWPKPTQYLRPKAQYRMISSSGTIQKDVPAENTEAQSGTEPVAIKFSYPIYQSCGQPYPDTDKIFRDLATESSGTYLIGKGNFFHGGIHITDKIAHHCKEKDMVRCVADGTVVAYRLNSSYLESTHKGEKLRYSSGFCLVRHDYASPQGKSGQRNALTFYSLYMHLAAYSDYKVAASPRVYKITESRLRARSKPSLGSDYIGYVSVGAQIEVSETQEFVNAGTTYVFAKGVLKSGQVKSDTGKVEAKTGNTIWVAIEKKGTPTDHYAVLVNAEAPALPGYWGGQPELEKVAACNVSIKAGDPIGRLGFYEIVANGQGGVISKRQVHLEVFTFDSKLEKFLKNSAGVKQGKQMHHIKKGTELWSQAGTEKEKTFEKGEETLPCDINLSFETGVIKDRSGKEWLGVEYTDSNRCLHGYVPAVSTETICNHDWEKIGFQCIKAPSNFDGYLPPILPPPFFQELYQKVTGNTAPIDRDSIRKALTGEQYNAIASKLVVMHVSDWKHNSNHNVWAVLDRIMKKSPEMVIHERERVDSCVWWDEVAAKVPRFDKTGVVWHFHPVEFIRCMKLHSDRSSISMAWGLKVSAAFKARVIEICARVGVDPDYLMSCMAFETGETFSPAIKNAAGSGAVGLVQFMPLTAKSLGTTTALLSVMTAEAQLDYVEKYFLPYRKKLKAREDVYMAILYPAAIGKAVDHVLFAHPSKTYEQNKGFDKNNDKKITVAEVSAKVRLMYEKGLKVGFYG